MLPLLVIYCNIANPQALLQSPITFVREVLALVQCPWLLHDEGALHSLREVYAEDAIERARQISGHMVSIGAYSPAKGYQFIRQHVAEFLQERDAGHPSDPEHIFLCDGASEGIRRVMSCLISDPQSGVLLPVPQYPLYSAAVTMLGGTILGYTLREEEGWSLDWDGMQRTLRDARARNVDVKLMCLINPGNPVGYHFDYDTLALIAKFCADEGITLLVDEVFQLNVYTASPFISMKRIISDLKIQVPLISFHGASKGFVGESGRRAGFMECQGCSQLLMDQIYKVASLGLCPNVDGQIVTDLMVRPPKHGDSSYDKYTEESTVVLRSLQYRIVRLSAALNALDGVECSQPEGSIYVFPRLIFPPKFITEALKVGRHPEFIYCSKLLEETGICILPGSGFGEKAGTFHVRITCLPAEDIFPEFMETLTSYHRKFMEAYSHRLE